MLKVGDKFKCVKRIFDAVKDNIYEVLEVDESDLLLLNDGTDFWWDISHLEDTDYFKRVVPRRNNRFKEYVIKEGEI